MTITSDDGSKCEALILKRAARWTGYVRLNNRNGKGVQVAMDKLTSRECTLLITAKVTLDPNTTGPETVFEGQDIFA